MKYQVGDKVLIRSNLVEDKFYGDDVFVLPMREHLGNVASIKKITGTKYCIDLDNELYHWTDEMFEYKMAFKVKCTKTQDERFILGKEYYIGENGRLIDENGYSMEYGNMSSYKAWYNYSHWVDYDFELVEDYTKGDVVKEECKVTKFKVGDRVRANAKSDDRYSITNLDNKWEGIVKHIYEDGLFESYDGYTLNSEYFDLIEESKHEPEYIAPKDQFLYKCNTKTDGSIAFNKVKMLTLCFVKFNHWGKVYTFINPTGKLLKEGTKVLVDSAGSDKVAYVVSSVKVQKKHAGDLLYAMTGKKGLELKNVLGVYETKTEIKEFDVLIKFYD